MRVQQCALQRLHPVAGLLTVDTEPGAELSITEVDPPGDDRDRRRSLNVTRLRARNHEDQRADVSPLAGVVESLTLLDPGEQVQWVDGSGRLLERAFWIEDRDAKDASSIAHFVCRSHGGDRVGWVG